MTGKLLRMTGGLGPLQELAVAAVRTIEFHPKADGTSVNLTYSVGGYVPNGADKLAPVVDQVLVALMNAKP